MTLCIWSKQRFTIKTIIYSDIFTSLRPKKVQLSPVQGIVQSILLFLCTELTLYCIELPENCIYLKQSELSNFSCICLTLSRSVCTLSILFSMNFLRCWHCQFVEQSRAFLVGDHFLRSQDLNVWFRGDNVRRNAMLGSLRESKG